MRTLKKTTLALLFGGTLALFAGKNAEAFKPGNYTDENGAILLVGADGHIKNGKYHYTVNTFLDWYINNITDGMVVYYAHSCHTTNTCPKGISPTGTMQVTALPDNKIKAVITGDDRKYTGTHVYHLEGNHK